jgi:DNA-binding XRE family transcriptional regulator
MARELAGGMADDVDCQATTEHAANAAHDAGRRGATMASETAEGRRALQQVRLLGELRALLGVSQLRLADSLGMTQSAISKLENRDNPSFQLLRAFVEVLGGTLLVEARFAQCTFEFVGGDEAPPASR